MEPPLRCRSNSSPSPLVATDGVEELSDLGMGKAEDPGGGAGRWVKAAWRDMSTKAAGARSAAAEATGTRKAFSDPGHLGPLSVGSIRKDKKKSIYR